VGIGCCVLPHRDPSSPQLSAVHYQVVTEVDTGGPLGDDDAIHGEAFDEAEVALAEARRRVADVPATTVVANHAIGLYELAAIHLSSQPVDLAQAALAIDALGGVLDAVGSRLGDDGEILQQALTTIRLAFVNLSGG
jgi:hypothetical protein